MAESSALIVDDEPDLLSEEDRTHIMARAGTRARAPAAVRKHLKRRTLASSAHADSTSSASLESARS